MLNKFMITMFIKALKENGIKNSNLNKAIELDLKDLNEKKWKFSGGHTDINLRTTVFSQRSFKSL